ncbi:hypothetical protein T484DRAFT_1628588, partial [Baffinella frigidus]
RIDGLHTRINGLPTQIDGLSARIDGLDTQVDGLSRRIDGRACRMWRTRTPRRVPSDAWRCATRRRSRLLPVKALRV